MRIREFFKDIHQKVIAVYFKIKKYMIYSKHFIRNKPNTHCKLIESHVKYGLFLFPYSFLFKIIENNSFFIFILADCLHPILFSFCI
jgi:hypothetical protein